MDSQLLNFALLTGGSLALVYFPAYKFGYSMWTCILIWTVGWLVLTKVLGLIPASQKFNPYYLIFEVPISLLPAYLFWKKFGLSGLGYSFLASLAVNLLRSL